MNIQPVGHGLSYKVNGIEIGYDCNPSLEEIDIYDEDFILVWEQSVRPLIADGRGTGRQLSAEDIFDEMLKETYKGYLIEGDCFDTNVGCKKRCSMGVLFTTPHGIDVYVKGKQ